MQNGLTYGNGAGNGSGRNGRNQGQQTPTPSGRGGNGNITLYGNEDGSYVPPHLRPGALPPRPDSVASFATQPPMTPYFPAVNPAVSTRYAYNGGQMEQHLAQLDLNNAMPPPSTPFGNGNGLASAINFTTPLNGPSPVSSANDSAVSQAQGIHLAQRISRGAAADGVRYDASPAGPKPRRFISQGDEPSSFQPYKRGNVLAGPEQASTRVNLRGNSAIYFGKLNKDGKPPQWFIDLMNGGPTPTVTQVSKSAPVTEGCRVAKPSTAGVIKLIGLPFKTAKPEIIAFLGKNAQICFQPVGSSFHAIHIIMDRLSGKTMDAYVEVENPREAAFIVKQFGDRKARGRQAKMGDRVVDVEMSSQGACLADCFPWAKSIVWHGAMPKNDGNIEYFRPGVPSTGFDGYFSSEEHPHMIKHVETPSRSPFTQRCIIRPYECIIYTIHKYPWYAVDLVLLKERNAMYDVALAGVNCLIGFLRRNGSVRGRYDSTMPTQLTLRELSVAVLTCPGFSEGQKAHILKSLQQGGFGSFCFPKGMNLRFGGQDAFAEFWPFRVLNKKPGASDEMMEYFASLLRDATNINQVTLAQLQSQRAGGSNMNAGHFGDLQINYGNATTIAEFARVELDAIERLLGFVLPATAAPPPPPYAGLGSGLAELAARGLPPPF